MARDGNAKGMKETKFKDTVLGKIPEEWEVCKVLDFTDVMTGATPSTENPDYWGGHILWMSSGELNKKFVYDVAGRITKEGYNSASTHMLPKNCVLIGLAGQGKTRGTAAINKIELCTNQSIGAILPSSDTDADYLFYFFDSQYQNLRALSSGDGGRGGLSKGLLLNYDVIRPHDKAEQQRIASALSDADALVAELDVLIEKKRSIMAGIMQELLTGKRRLQGYNEKWKESAIEDIGNLIRGVSFDSDSVSTSFFENSIPILRANNIVDGNLFLHDLIFVDKHFVKEHQYHRENDILICSANGSKRLVGKAALIKSDDNMSFGAFMTTLRCNNASMALYFSMFMRTDEYRKQINDLLCGSAINNLNSKQLYTIKLKHPSDQAEQHAIATILSDMDAEIAELEAKRDKYKEVRQGMMQQLLTGKIRLI